MARPIAVHRLRSPLALAIATLTAGLSSPAVFAEEESTLAPVVVTATRTSEDVTTVPQAVTVIDKEQIAEQAGTAASLSEILGKLVPGMAVGSGTQTNYNQTIRGRGILVLIDGVPQITVRNVARDLMTIDPAMVERVEVIRGATAIYGHGASGGVVNIITKKPAKGETRFTTEIGAQTSLTKLKSDGVGGRVRQGISHDMGQFDASLNLSAEHLPAQFDADGDRIAPEPAQGDLTDTDTFGLSGKLGWEADKQRLELAFNRYRAEQDSDYVSDPAVNSAPPASVPSRPKHGLQLATQPESENDIVNLSYRHDDVLGSKLESQLYHRDYMTLFFPFDGRAVSGYTGNQVVQSYLDSQTWGGRLALDTPLFSNDTQLVSLLWGADYASEDTEQRVRVFDRTAYTNSGGLRYVPIDDRSWVPPIEHAQFGFFTQLEWMLNDKWTVRGGARQDLIDVKVNDFRNLGTGATVKGGDVEYDDISYNLGATYAATDAVSLYASYAEGFSLPDVGLILRGAAPTFVVSNTTLQPLDVKNYEIGARGNWQRVQSTLSLFYSTSKLGFFSAGLNNPVQRAPERTQGLEATTDVFVTDSLTAGGAFSWVEGEYEDAKKGEWVALNGFRVAPPKLTMYVEHETATGWRNRLQALYSGNRDDAYEDKPGTPTSFGRASVHPYTVVDLQSSLKLGAGTLSVGIENLFNEDYYNVFSQLLYQGNVSHFKAPGRTLRLGYAMTY